MKPAPPDEILKKLQARRAVRPWQLWLANLIGVNRVWWFDTVLRALIMAASAFMGFVAYKSFGMVGFVLGIGIGVFCVWFALVWVMLGWGTQGPNSIKEMTDILTEHDEWSEVVAKWIADRPPIEGDLNILYKAKNASRDWTLLEEYNAKKKEAMKKLMETAVGNFIQQHKLEDSTALAQSTNRPPSRL